MALLECIIDTGDKFRPQRRLLQHSAFGGVTGAFANLGSEVAGTLGEGVINQLID